MCCAVLCGSGGGIQYGIQLVNKYTPGNTNTTPGRVYLYKYTVRDTVIGGTNKSRRSIVYINIYYFTFYLIFVFKLLINACEFAAHQQDLLLDILHLVTDVLDTCRST